MVAPSLAALDLYCDRVAAAVGRLSVRAFGDRGAAAAEVAHHLGRALQLTNILRDLEEDRARGRLYLPREYLAAEGVPPNPDAALSHPALRQVCGRVVVDARHHFAAAERAMRRANGARDAAGARDGGHLRRPAAGARGPGLGAGGAGAAVQAPQDRGRGRGPAPPLGPRCRFM